MKLFSLSQLFSRARAKRAHTRFLLLFEQYKLPQRLYQMSIKYNFVILLLTFIKDVLPNEALTTGQRPAVTTSLS